MQFPNRLAKAVTDSNSGPPNGERRSYAKLSKLLTEPGLDLRANERLVALVIFQHVDLDTMICWPSIGTIGRRARVSRNTVCRTIKKLKALAILTVSKERDAGKFFRSVYDFSPLLWKTTK